MNNFSRINLFVKKYLGEAPETAESLEMLENAMSWAPSSNLDNKVPTDTKSAERGY